MTRTLFILGATGFIGRATVVAAIAAGWRVIALARSDEGAARLRADGARPVLGDVARPGAWIDEARGATALIDLVQPNLPTRMSRSAMDRVSRERQAGTAGILTALRGLPAADRPLLCSISGLDDLQADGRGVVDHCSPLRDRPRGFGRIGLPVRRLIEQSGLETAYLYLGFVYGPGKVFAAQYVDGLRAGKAPVVGRGDNYLPLTHVEDAARAIVHLAGQPRAALVGRTFVITDGADPTQRALLDYTAGLMGVKRASRAPAPLVALVAGRVTVEVIARDVHADPAALLGTGFAFRYPSYREGVPATLAALGHAPGAAAPAAPASRS
jgi:nucleoside-diphosphate-sugar epimerase